MKISESLKARDSSESWLERMAYGLVSWWRAFGNVVG